jgi:nuclear pore complex protein Nup93
MEVIPSPIVPATPGKGGRSLMDIKMLEYARVICELNDKRLNGEPFGIITRFLEVARNLEDRNLQQKAEIEDCWEILRKLLHEENVNKDGTFRRDPLREREYAQLNIQEPNRLREFFRRGACAFLEEQYDKIIQNIISNNLEKARIGGNPSRIQFVKGYLNILFDYPNKPFPEELEKGSDGYPLWALIYYLIRCGDLNSALTVATNVSATSNFAAFLKSYIDHRDTPLPEEIQRQIIQEYRKLSRSDKDPYKILLYNLLGKCDPQRSHNDILRWTAQDFMWFKLNMVTSMDDSGPPQMLSLPRLQTIIRDFGPSHFNRTGQQPLLYFQLLLLSQQFEFAIQYLDQTQQFPVETFHYAYVLYYYGVLRQPSAPTFQIFVEEGKEHLCVNFVRLIEAYVKIFAHTDVLAALHYLYLIQDEDARHRSIKDLILETREFDQLLGALQDDGSRKGGLLEKFLPRAKWTKIVELAAADSENSGKYEDAIKLYDLAQYYDKVVSLLCHQLGRVVVGHDEDPSVKDADRKQLIELADALIDKYQKAGTSDFVSKIDPNNFLAFKQLKALVKFFDLYHSGRFAEALDTMKTLNIIPFHTKEIEEKVNNFKKLNEAVRRNFAEILVATMTCLYKLYSKLKAELSVDPSREQLMKELQAESKAVVMFSGMVQFRMSSDVHSKLLRLEVYMN